MLTVLLAQRSLYDHVAAVASALDDEGLEGARAAISHIVGRDPASLDEEGVGRAAIESLAENFSDGVVAPVFWFLMLGLPGICAYKAVNTLDSMIGHRSERYRAFGWAAARLDDVANLVPARLAGVLIAIAAVPMPRASGWNALRIMLRHGPQAPLGQCRLARGRHGGRARPLARGVRGSTAASWWRTPGLARAPRKRAPPRYPPRARIVHPRLRRRGRARRSCGAAAATGL